MSFSFSHEILQSQCNIFTVTTYVPYTNQKLDRVKCEKIKKEFRPNLVFIFACIPRVQLSVSFLFLTVSTARALAYSPITPLHLLIGTCRFVGYFVRLSHAHVSATLNWVSSHLFGAQHTRSALHLLTRRQFLIRSKRISFSFKIHTTRTMMTWGLWWPVTELTRRRRAISWVIWPCSVRRLIYSPALIKAGRALGFRRVLNQIPGDRCTRFRWEIYSAKIWMFGVARETRYFAQQKKLSVSPKDIRVSFSGHKLHEIKSGVAIFYQPN